MCLGWRACRWGWWMATVEASIGWVNVKEKVRGGVDDDIKVSGFAKEAARPMTRHGRGRGGRRARPAVWSLNMMSGMNLRYYRMSSAAPPTPPRNPEPRWAVKVKKQARMGAWSVKDTVLQIYTRTCVTDRENCLFPVLYLLPLFCLRWWFGARYIERWLAHLVLQLVAQYWSYSLAGAVQDSGLVQKKMLFQKAAVSHSLGWKFFLVFEGGMFFIISRSLL